MRYVHYEKIIFKESNKDEWTVRVAKSIDEATELLQVGFEYVADWKDAQIYRKRK